MEEVTLERDDRGPITFCGELIASQSSERARSQRWTELRIYKTTALLIPWIVQSLGVSTMEGERNFSKVVKCATAKEVVDALRLRDGRLTGLGLDTAEDASEKDERIDEYLDELFESEELE